jgi:uncharacterized protein
MYLPDINLWLALAFDAHVHHPAAKTWFDRLSSQKCFFCRLTQQGFLRLATNSKAVGTAAVPMAQAWQLFDLYLSDPRVAFADEPANLEMHWRGLTQSQKYSPKVWSDAYLAAFALSAQLELVTFDQGFAQYTNVPCTILS